MVETYGTARLEVIDAKLRPGVALLRCAERREAEHVGRLLVQKLGEAALKVIVGCHVVEDGLTGLERWQVAPPTEWPGLGKAEVRLVELDGAPLDRQLRDLAGQVLRDAFLHLQPGQVRAQRLGIDVDSLAKAAGHYIVPHCRIQFGEPVRQPSPVDDLVGDARQQLVSRGQLAGGTLGLMDLSFRGGELELQRKAEGLRQLLLVEDGGQPCDV